MTDSQDSAPGNPPKAELLLRLDELVSKLRPAERDALVLRFLQGLDLHAAASSLGISSR